jgi:hypothetical protein
MSSNPQRITVRILLVSLGFFVEVTTERAAQAVLPPTYTDAQLAGHPIIVVGRWNKADVRMHNLIEGNTALELESQTELLIERVIKGDVKPGVHPLLLNSFLGWEREDGGPLICYTSSRLPGEVKDVTESNVWFLKPGRSWDKKDETKYLEVGTYRNVQPLVLADYYQARSSDKPHQEVPKLLTSDKPAVVSNAFVYLCGDVTPWPYDRLTLAYHEVIPRSFPPLSECAGDVAKLLEHDDLDVRRLATAAYAETAGARCVPRMRELLSDADSELRAVAVGALIRNNDAASADACVKALCESVDPEVAYKLVRLISDWKAPQAVPALLEILDTTGCAYVHDDPLSIPAWKARETLKTLTGHTFPFDVEAARRAWDQVKSIDEAEARTRKLAELLPYKGEALEVKTEKKGKRTYLVVRNRSAADVVVANVPDYLRCRTDDGEWSQWLYAYLNERTPERFTTLRPGKSVRKRLDEESARRIATSPSTILFQDDGSRFGLKAWVGRLELPAPKTD